MPSSFSTNLGLELQATGENIGTWGTKTNDNLSNILDAIFDTADTGAPGLRITGNGRFDGNLSLGVAAASTRLHSLLAAATVYSAAVPAIADSNVLLSNTTSGGNIQTGILFNINSGGFDRRNFFGAISENAANRKMALVFATDNGSARSEKMRLTGDGRLGLGTTAPDILAQIEGGTDITLIGKTGFLAIGDADAQHIAIDDDEIQSKSNGTTAANLFINALGGDVGIGTSSIAGGSRLHVAEAVDDGAAILSLENSQTNEAASTSETADFETRFGGVLAARIRTGKELDFTPSSDESSFISIYNKRASSLLERFKITADGNFLLKNWLGSNMNLDIDAGTSGNWASRVRLLNAGTLKGEFASEPALNEIYIADDFVKRISLFDNGNTVIRSGNPNDDILLGSSTTTRVTIEGDTGNVGIGVAPANKLHVSGGNVRVDNNANATAFFLNNTDTGGVEWLFQSIGNIGGRQGNFEIARPGVSTPFTITSGGNIGITGAPNANAVLDVQSTTKAFMPPRMTTTQRDNIASPTAGMVVYNTTTNVLDFYNGTGWGAV